MKIRIGIIGHTGRGNFGHNIRQGFEQSPLFEVADVLDLGLHSGVDNRASVIDEFVHRSFDGIVVSQRFTDSHKDVVAAALNADKHVYCEKPLVSSLSDVDFLAKLAADRKKTLAVALPAVHEHRFELLTGMIENGLIGEVYELRGLTKWDYRGGGEDALILGLHLVDLMLRLAGPAVECVGSVLDSLKQVRLDRAHLGGEGAGLVAGDQFRGFYRFASGISGTLTSIRADVEDRDDQPYRLEVRGTNGILTFRAPYADGSIWHYPLPEVIPGKEEWRLLHMQRTNYAKYHEWAAVDWWSAITEGRAPASDVSSYMSALELIQGVYVSGSIGRALSLPLQEREHPLSFGVI